MKKFHSKWESMKQYTTFSNRLKSDLQYLEMLEKKEKEIARLREEWASYIARKVVRRMKKDENGNGWYLELEDMETARLLRRFIDREMKKSNERPENTEKKDEEE